MIINSETIFGRSGLYLIVFLSGASVMVIELLGTRMIAPFYGASLYVWSSLISVTMIALALGYFVGGRWADRAKRTGLSLIIALAGLLTLLIPWAAPSILLATDSLGLRIGAFVSALTLFSPSLSLLGMVGPFAIKMATSRLDGVGNSAGSIYAVSTVGSVVGTLLLGFYLFPMVGAREILMGLGIVLLLMAIPVAVYEKDKLGLAPALIPVVLTAVGLSLLPKVADAGHAYGGDNKYRLLSERESLYGWVRVIDQKSNNLRLLMSDASAIGAASITTGENLLGYQNIVKLIPALQPKMTRALVIGLGAGHMARMLHDRYGIVTDTLEIDPAVADAATRYFDFQPTGLAVIGDARYEIRRLKGPYDLIIHDCFTGGSEPAHLLTAETLTQLRGLLSDQGILAVNFVALLQGGRSAALSSVARTIDSILPHRTAFIADPGNPFNDFIFLAANRPIDINAETLLPEQRAWLKHRLFEIDATEGALLTDNLNPLEHLQTAKAEHYRRFVIDLFGVDLFIR